MDDNSFRLPLIDLGRSSSPQMMQAKVINKQIDMK